MNRLKSTTDVPDEDDVLVDAMPFNGDDVRAARRAHMRELTMARQAAERRSVQANVSVPRGAAEWADDARERVERLRAELAQLQAGHRAWLASQGMLEVARIGRKRRAREEMPA